MSLRELYTLGRDSLKKSGIENPDLEASILLSRTLGVSKTDVYAHPEMEVEDNRVKAFNQMLERRLRGEPIAYILGEKEFYSRTFLVNPSVLIPRPETEILVEEALRVIENLSFPLVADVGTGSGCIAVTIGCECKDTQIFATDVSLDALTVARANAQRHGVSSHISFISADFLSCFRKESLDVVLSNPPYVSAVDFFNLEPKVRDFEPKVSLFGGEDGLNCIRRILPQAARVLKDNGWCIIEIGANQSEKTAEIFDGMGFKDISVVEDLAGIVRVVKGKWIK
jgi:release factor glutamine methyltransferase